MVHIYTGLNSCASPSCIHIHIQYPHIHVQGSTVEHLHKALWTPAGLPPFSPAISRDDPYPPKPDPSALLSIANTWHIFSKELSIVILYSIQTRALTFEDLFFGYRGMPLGPHILMVGDSAKNDVSFGKAAGVSTFLLDTGRRSYAY